jgi:hypothetical protein
MIVLTIIISREEHRKEAKERRLRFLSIKGFLSLIASSFS